MENTAGNDYPPTPPEQNSAETLERRMFRRPGALLISHDDDGLFLKCPVYRPGYGY